MTPAYLTPAGRGAAELTVKRSRFIGEVRPAGDAGEAMRIAAGIRAEHRDARHNCWCYLLRGGAARYSDDGEPQGTAGAPMLEVFKRSGVVDLCCVVTRYFGGVLLGAGGLARAYSGAARLALDAAGTAARSPVRLVALRCPYGAAGRLKAEAEAFGGEPEGAEYGADVALRFWLPEASAAGFAARAAEISAGAADVDIGQLEFR